MIGLIVTAYNIKEYIEECLSSIYSLLFNNTYKCIIVEDKSTDNTLDIIKDFISTHNKENLSWFLIENPINVGAGKGRLIGIDKAKELNVKYTTFLDGDDTVEPNYLQVLYDKSIETSADITTVGFNVYKEGKVVNKIDDTHLGEVLENSDKFNMTHVMNPYLNNKLINIDLWYKVNYSSLRFIEDICTENRLAYYANKIVIIKDYLYNYRIRPNSLCTGSDIVKKTIYGCLAAIENYEFFKDKMEGLTYQLKFHFGPYPIKHIWGQLNANYISESDPRLKLYTDEIKIIKSYFNVN